MADNYLENHYEEYLKRKAAWEKKKKKKKTVPRNIASDSVQENKNKDQE